MDKQLKKQIKYILNNEDLDINEKITKIKEIDKDEDINILWDNLYDMDLFTDYVKQQDNIIQIFDIFDGINRSCLMSSEYIYYDGVYDWKPVEQIEEYIINEIKEALD